MPIKLDEISWGSGNADNDENFEETLVEHDSFLYLLKASIAIISGGKGAGKSAIRQAYLRKYSEEFCAIYDVNFDDVSFKNVLDNLLTVGTNTNLARLQMLSEYLGFTFCSQAMLHAARQLDHPGFQERIENLLDRKNISTDSEQITEDKVLDRRTFKPLMDLLQKVQQMLDQFTRPKHEKPSNRLIGLIGTSGLTPAELEEIKNFPNDKEYKKLKKEFFAHLRAENKKILIVCDGFDKLRNDSANPDQINLMFSSIADAVYNLKSDPSSYGCLVVKALFPDDRYSSIDVRDSDKLEGVHGRVRWTPNALREYLLKRMTLHPRMPRTFTAAWREIFPDDVQNHIHSVKEDVFSYLLRHTMWRPRQLYLHLKAITEHFSGRDIEMDEIPSVVHNTCVDLFKNFIKEYYIDHNYLDGFAESFKTKTNVMEYREFVNRFEQYVSDHRYRKKDGEPLDVNAEIEKLYSMGFFGLIKLIANKKQSLWDDIPPNRGANTYRTDFFYKSAVAKISSSTNDKDLIALHPIIFHAKQLKHHPDYIVG